jgi:hypothetical protein
VTMRSDDSVALESAGELTVPADATPEETAAIVAAVGTHLSDREVAAGDGDGGGDGGTWDGRRWQFAGRLGGLSGVERRVPRGAPTDGWTAAGRLDGRSSRL